MFDMITIGDIKLDTFVVLDDANVQCQIKMPECQLCMEYGAKIAVEVVDSQIAGTAPNIAIGLSRMGFKTAVISNMGEDGTRKMALERLKAEKVSTQYVKAVKGAQSSYSAVLSFKGEKTILTSHIPHINRLPKPLPKTNWFYIGEMGVGYEKLYQSMVNHAKQTKSLLLGFNPGSIQVQERKPALYNLFKRTFVLFLNLEEAQTVVKTHTREIHHLAKNLWELGPHIVVITDGKNGSHSFDGQELNFCPIFPGKMVESTGAGDSFATGFLGAIMNGLTHDEALRWGSVNAASVVGQVGPTAGLLTANQIKSRLRARPSFKVKQE